MIAKLKSLLTALVLISCLQVSAHEYRDLLQKTTTVQELKNLLLPVSQWNKIPAYNNRAAWDQLSGKYKAQLIAAGEKQLSYEWKVVKATDYLEYEWTGSRVAMEKPFTSNVNALSALILAELSEGKGRFMNQIVNGVWQACEMSSWVLSAHMAAQKSTRSLPDFTEQIIDLTAGDLGSFFSWTYFLLKEEMDKKNPIIAKKLRKNLQDRILDPYMARDDYWWQAVNAKPTTMVNNWNPWCNFNVLTCFLLLESDKDKQAAAVYKSMVSVDKFINYNHADGACEEGPSYWGHAAGKMYDYLQLLSNATGSKVSIFNQPIIKNMGEYIARSYVGDGWVVNFADASAKGGGNPGLIYRYGKAVNSSDMQHFAAYLAAQIKEPEMSEGRDLFRTFENLSNANDLAMVTASVVEAKYSWYPQTQFCYMNNGAGLFFAAKAGYNAESHNHNDVGTFSLYVDKLPMIIDVGVGTYTRQTFSSERYTIWTMQSNYHNLPMINGKPQSFGGQYRAKNVQFDSVKNTFSLDMATAYHKDVLVEKWLRNYQLSTTKGLTITDQFQLQKAEAPNQLNFMTWGKPDISQAGEVLIEKDGKKLALVYDKNLFQPSVDMIAQTDPRLSAVWGKEVYRLSLTAKQIVGTGKYVINISKR